MFFVDNGDDGIYDQVATIPEEVKSHHVSRFGAIRNAQAPSFQNNGRFWDANISKEYLDDAHEARVKQVANVSVRTANDMALRY